jgi:hypothetical protein
MDFLNQREWGMVFLLSPLQCTCSIRTVEIRKRLREFEEIRKRLHEFEEIEI